MKSSTLRRTGLALAVMVSVLSANAAIPATGPVGAPTADAACKQATIGGKRKCIGRGQQRREAARARAEARRVAREQRRAEREAAAAAEASAYEDYDDYDEPSYDAPSSGGRPGCNPATARDWDGSSASSGCVPNDHASPGWTQIEVRPRRGSGAGRYRLR